MSPASLPPIPIVTSRVLESTASSCAGWPYCVPVMPAVVAPLQLTSLNDAGLTAAATSDG
jgi:hypothetical protein